MLTIKPQPLDFALDVETCFVFGFLLVAYDFALLSLILLLSKR